MRRHPGNGLARGGAGGAAGVLAVLVAPVVLTLGYAGHQPFQVRFLFPREAFRRSGRRINQDFGATHDSVGDVDPDGARFIARLTRIRIELGIGQPVHLRIMHWQKDLPRSHGRGDEHTGVNTAPA